MCLVNIANMRTSKEIRKELRQLIRVEANDFAKIQTLAKGLAAKMHRISVLKKTLARKKAKEGRS